MMSDYTKLRIKQTYLTFLTFNIKQMTKFTEETAVSDIHLVSVRSSI